MKRAISVFVIACLLFPLFATPADAAYDLWVDYVSNDSDFSHIKGEFEPEIEVRYRLEEARTTPLFCMVGMTMMVSVKLELRKTGQRFPEATFTLEHDRCLADFDTEKQFSLPLYNPITQQPLPLTESEYFIRATIDPDQEWTELDETNNTTNSSVFYYTIYSGDILFGDIVTSADAPQITRKATVENIPCTGSRYYIEASTGSWQNSWGTANLSFPAGYLCADGATAADGYSIDLDVAAMTANVEDLNDTIGGLNVDLTGVTLGSTGMSFTEARLHLPDGVSLHPTRTLPKDTLGVDPHGLSYLAIAGGGPVDDPEDILISRNFSEVYHFHSYGLPFYLRASGYTIDFGNSMGLQLSNPSPRYIHMDTIRRLEGRDSRRYHGLPSNDTPFLTAATAANASISGHGLDVSIGCEPRSSLTNIYGSEQMTDRPLLAFPYGQLDWQNGFDLEVDHGMLVDGIELTGLSFLLPFDGGCPGTNCGDPLQETIFTVALPSAGMIADGSFGGTFADLQQPTTWGLLRDPQHNPGEAGYNPHFTYERDDSNLPGIVYVPGFIITGSGSGDYTISQYLHGSRQFAATDMPGDLHYLDDPDDPDAARGNHYFAGINLGPESLVPLSSGLTGPISANPLSILFNGQDSQLAFNLHDYSKYILRSGGLTGVFNTTFSGDIEIYGYTLHLSRFGFRQVVNRLDERSLIDGSVDLPFPAGVEVAFSDLDLTCTGDFTGGNVETESCNGADSEGDGVIDEGCYQALVYWNTPIDYLGMSFENKDRSSACPVPDDRALRLTTRNQVNGITAPVRLHAFWNPDGSPEQDRITATADTVLDPPEPIPDNTTDNPGFFIQIRDGYLSYPENGSYLNPSPDAGFTNLIATVKVPLFDALPIHSHLINGEPDANGALDPSEFNLFLFNDESAKDGENHDGVPTGYANLSSYREAVGKSEEILSPDPRPRAQYSWPNSGVIQLDYPLRYNKADGVMPPQFLGIKQQGAITAPILSVYSVPDYLKPLRTKLSFGFSAEFTELSNYTFNLGDLSDLEELDSILGNLLGVDLNLGGDDGLLTSLVGEADIMHRLTGGDLTALLEASLETALATSEVSSAIDAVVEAIDIAHSGPALVAAQFEKVLQLLKQDIEVHLASGLHLQLDQLFDPAHDMVQLLSYSPQTIDRAIADGILPDPGNLPELRAELKQLRSGLQRLHALHAEAGKVIGSAQAGLEEVRSNILTAIGGASARVSDLETAIDNLAGFTSIDPETNPLLQQLDQARSSIQAVRDAIDALQLQAIAAALKTAVAGFGGSLDTSLVADAEQFVKNHLQELDDLLKNAETRFNNLLPDVGMDGVFSDAHSLVQNIATHLNSLEAPVNQLFDIVLVNSNGTVPADGGYAAIIVKGLERIKGFIEAFERNFDTLPDGVLLAGTTWTDLAAEGQQRLTELAREQLVELSEGATTLADKANALLTQVDHPTTPRNAYTTLIDGLVPLLTAPLEEVIIGVKNDLEGLLAASLGFLPDPDADDIREMIKLGVLNSSVVRDINLGFTTQFDFIAEYIDDLTLQLTTQLNGLITGAIAAVDAALDQQIADVASVIGGTGGGLSAAKIDGYGIVAQNEFERFHLEAEFTFDAKPEPTTYFAGLDIAAWNAENGKGNGCVNAAGGDGLIDVSISTRDITAAMLGTSLGIKEALLGFTLQGTTPIGIYGKVYTLGEVDFETLVLSDMGLEAGVGAEENYLGAKARGRFGDYSIYAAFFLGQSCDYTILKRLDPEIAEFLGERNGLTGVYARGSAKVPIYNYSCALKVGVGADIGAWYLADAPVSYGGLLGGSAYGRVACLAALKGEVTLIGAKVGEQYRFSGSGWGAGGIGWCDPSGWTSISKSRSDDWCMTGDAAFTAEYRSSWSIDGPDISCCY